MTMPSTLVSAMHREPHDLPIQIDPAPTQRQHFTQAHPGEQGAHCRSIRMVTAHFVDKGRDILHDNHFSVVDLWRRDGRNDILRDQFQAEGTAQSLPEDAVSAPDGTRAQSAFVIGATAGRSVVYHSSMSSVRSFCTSLAPRCGTIWKLHRSRQRSAVRSLMSPLDCHRSIRSRT